jgi:hypothetical protein
VLALYGGGHGVEGFTHALLRAEECAADEVAWAMRAAAEPFKGELERATS